MAKTRQMKSQNQIPPSNGTRDINKRHSARQKKRRRNARRRRMFLFMLLLIISTIIIMFMTPVFNIRSVKIIGNEKVTTEEITSKTESAINQNLFKINLKQLSSSISSFAYLKDIKISRIIYPPSLKVSVTESTPAITVYYNGEYAILDEFCKVLEMEQGKSNGDTTTPQYETDDGTSTLVVKSGSEVAGNLEKPANLPEILGLDINNCIIGEKLSIDESNKFDIILLCIQELKAAELFDKVNVITFNDINNITFEYDGRIDVICGSENDLEKKIALFKEVITSNRLPDNSRGTLDLSTAGKAIYTP